MKSVSLYTCAPQLSNDMAEVLRLYMGNITLLVNEAGGDFCITHTEEIKENQRLVSACMEGKTVQESADLTGDEVIDKRLRRRMAKLCIYSLMKAHFGFTPPWGSLTGIRPTRLVYAEMEKGRTLDEASAQVQRIFDVSSEKLSVMRDIITVQQTLPVPQQDEIDIYIGIPFCVSRCAYCSFLSGEVGNGKLLTPYVDALEREIQLSLRLLEEKQLRPRAFYMGGGTPTSLPAPLLARVLTAARPLMERCSEVTVEAGRPDTIDRDKLQALLDARVTRISVNPQTMHDETLQRIGRHHTCKQTEDAYRLARDMGFDHINMDLIAGLPGENLSMFRQTLDWLRDLSPESMTVHTLSIKRASLLHLWEAQLPDGDMVADMVRAGAAAAKEMQMEPYYLYRQKYMAGNQENVGYALKDHACLYNIDMMEETANVLAMGAGAASKRLFDRKGFIKRAFNVSDICQYIDRVEEMAQRKRELWEMAEEDAKEETKEGTVLS
ncbi:MAG: coproporphyrinogen dehydrogenase HemZ [Clostridia bacterium]|nr:coproporphyrinogen dehydrogenase HemZ [Clostridia bacterium]